MGYRQKLNQVKSKQMKYSCDLIWATYDNCFKSTAFKILSLNYNFSRPIARYPKVVQCSYMWCSQIRAVVVPQWNDWCSPQPTEVSLICFYLAPSVYCYIINLSTQNKVHCILLNAINAPKLFSAVPAA